MFSTLRKIAEDNDEDWDEYTDGALFAINTNRSNTTKFSPFYLMYGRHPRLPLEVQRYVEHVDNDPGEIEKTGKSINLRGCPPGACAKNDSHKRCTFPISAGKYRSCTRKAKEAVLKKKRSLPLHISEWRCCSTPQYASKDKKGAQNGRPVDWPIYDRRG